MQPMSLLHCRGSYGSIVRTTRYVVRVIGSCARRGRAETLLAGPRAATFSAWYCLRPCVSRSSGSVVGLIAAVGAMRVMAGLLYGTPTNDLVVYASVSLIAFVVALVASWVPARRAARVDPVIALRAF